MLRFAAALTLTAAAATAGAASFCDTNGKWKNVFTDEFTGTALNLSVWTPQVRTGRIMQRPESRVPRHCQWHPSPLHTRLPARPWIPPCVLSFVNEAWSWVREGVRAWAEATEAATEPACVCRWLTACTVCLASPRDTTPQEPTTWVTSTCRESYCTPDNVAVRDGTLILSSKREVG